MIDLTVYEAATKLRFSPAEAQLVSPAIQMLLASFDQLAAVDTENTPPLVTVLPGSNRLREDVAAKTISKEEILACAPEEYDGYFQVPKTLD